MSIALWCLVIAALLPLVAVGLAKVGSDYDNAAPREAATRLVGWRKRAYAAHLNAYEAFPLFAAAVLVAETQGTPRGLADALALVWVGARIAHLVFYAADRPTLRSTAWSIAFLVALALMTSPAWS